MPVLLDDIKGYLESTVGLEAHLQAATGLKVPFHIKDAYKLVYLALMVGPKSKQKLPMLLLLPVENKYPGAVTLGKHIAQVQKATDKVVVYVCQSLSVPERRSLIANNINFIQPGYQMFIPELAMDLRESVRTRRNEDDVSALLPAAQAMVLARLYEGWDSDTIFTSSAIMGEFKYSRVTLAKVIDQLLKLGIIHPAQSHGFKNSYSFGAPPSGVFKKVRHFMRSPVKRKIGINIVLRTGNGVFLAGETALAKLTMLAEPAQPVFGMTKKQFDAMVEEQTFKVTDSIDEIRAWVEIWAYRSLREGKNIADEASLLLSLEDIPDERVQLALDELKENVKWLKKSED
ncbi:hypothetical protein [Pseudomonas savastanoi]|uniref:hypothetical protein n=1 Tax=Pseudomonas savastanoi TaxID=29438 RepID=UPI000E32935D|nr:hypothetical protein [Pseudomonas savastanoi]